MAAESKIVARWPLVALVASALWAHAAAAAPHELIYATDSNFGAVSVIDTDSLTVVRTIPLPDTLRSNGLAFSPDRRRVYVTGSDSNLLFVVDTDTNAIIDTIAVEEEPLAVAVSPDGARAYVSNAMSDTVSVIDTTFDAVIATIPVGGTPIGIALNSDGSKAYIANYGDVIVSVIDTRSNTVVHNLPVGFSPIALRRRPHDTSIYLTRQEFDPRVPSLILSIDPASDTLTQLFPDRPASTRDGFTGMAFTPDGQRLVLANGSHSNSVSVVDVATREFLTTFHLQGSGPFAVTMSADGRFAYISDWTFLIATTSGTVAVMDTVTNQVTKTIQRVGNAPYAIEAVVSEPTCGNGIVDPGEQCDDGNFVGGDGCAPNCTLESERPMVFDPAASNLTFHTNTGEFAGSVSGTLTLLTGGAGPNGSIPLSLRSADLQIQPVSVPGIGCVCLQAAPDPQLAPGIAGHGEIGCGSITRYNFSMIDAGYFFDQFHTIDASDPTCFTGTREPPDAPHPGVCNGPRRLVFFGAGLQGDAVLESTLQMYVIRDGGSCAVDPRDPEKGADGLPCTADDPGASAARSLGPLMTGAITPDNALDAQSAVTELDNRTTINVGVTGSPFECGTLERTATAGGEGVTLVSAAPFIDTPFGDLVVTAVFAGAPVRTITPTDTATPTTTATPTATPSATVTPTRKVTGCCQLHSSTAEHACYNVHDNASCFGAVNVPGAICGADGLCTGGTPTLSATPTVTCTASPSATATASPAPTITATVPPTAELSPTATVASRGDASGGGCTMAAASASERTGWLLLTTIVIAWRGRRRRGTEKG